jgi:hypothetical protein
MLMDLEKVLKHSIDDLDACIKLVKVDDDEAKSSRALAMAAVEEARSQAHLVNDCAADAQFAYIPHDVYATLWRK